MDATAENSARKLGSQLIGSKSEATTAAGITCATEPDPQAAAEAARWKKENEDLRQRIEVLTAGMQEKDVALARMEESCLSESMTQFD